MYNGIGLQTARGSGTNGYVQTNKFFVRPRTSGKPVNGGKGFEDDQGTAGLSKKPNKDILEHDRKRQIHLKLAILEDKLADQGYSDAEISQKLEEARVNLEAAAASEDSDETKISDTQTHQVAARKEKQMEAFRAALGLPDQQQAEEGIIEDEPMGEAYEGGVGRLKERREHSFLDRDSGRKLDEDVDEKIGNGKGKESKKQRGDDDIDELKRHKKKVSKKRRHDDSSESDEHVRDRRRRSKKKARGRKQDTDSESDSSSSDSESDSDSDSGEKRRKATKKRSRSKRSVSSESEEVESDDSKKLRKSHKKSRPSNRSGSKEVKEKHVEQKRAGRKRHDSDVSESESEDDKQLLRKKEEAYRGERKQRRDEEDVESNHLKDRYRGDSGGKKVARDFDDSEIEFEKKKQLRSKVEVYSGGMKQKIDEEDAVSNKTARDSDDSEAGYGNRKQLKDGRKHRSEEDDNHGRDRYRGDGDGYNKHKMDRYRGRALEEEGNRDKGDDDDGYKHERDRYKPRRESVKEDEEDYKHGRDRYRVDKEDRFRGRVSDEDDERNSREREYSNKGRSHSSGKRSSYGDRV